LKFNIRKPSHYVIYIIFCINFLISVFIVIFYKKPKKQIILFGHLFEGNLKYFYQQKEKLQHEIFYVSFSHKEYKSLKKEKIQVLSPLSLFNVFQIIRSNVFIASHGIPFHNLLSKLTDIKFFNIGHGITNTLVIGNPIQPNELFHSYWLPSEFEKKVWEEAINRTVSILKPTGFIRVENLVLNNKSKGVLKTKLNLQGKVALFAPSGVEKYDLNENDNFQYSNIKFLNLLETLCIQEDINLIFKPHYFNYEFKDIENEVVTFISNSEKLIYFEDLDIDDFNELLIISDFLLTDYSSIFVDFLSLGKPIIFLDVEKRMENTAFTKYLDNEFIEFINTFEEFKKVFSNISKEEKYSNKLYKLDKIIYDDIYKTGSMNNYMSDLSKVLEIDIKDI